MRSIGSWGRVRRACIAVETSHHAATTHHRSSHHSTLLGNSSSCLVSLSTTSKHKLRSRHHHLQVMWNEVKGSGGDFLFFFGFFFLFNFAVPVSHFWDKLDHEGHDKIVHVESPGILKSKVRLNILIASVKSSSEELLLLSLYKEFKQLFDNFLVVRFLSSFNGVSVDFVLLGQVDALLVFSILSVEVSSDASELEQLMSLCSLSQIVRIDVGVFLNRFSQCFVIFNIKIEFIKGFIDLFCIGLLDDLQEWFG